MKVTISEYTPYAVSSNTSFNNTFADKKDSPPITITRKERCSFTNDFIFPANNDTDIKTIYFPASSFLNLLYFLTVCAIKKNINNKAIVGKTGLMILLLNKFRLLLTS